jgi:type IV secretion system protein VirB3
MPMPTDELEAVTMHRALARDNLFLGGDRELVLFSALVSATLVFYVLEWVAAAVGVALWVSSLFVFRLMAKHDPKLRFVYLRHRIYRAFYPARATPFHVPGEKQERQYREPWTLYK